MDSSPTCDAALASASAIPRSPSCSAYVMRTPRCRASPSKTLKGRAVLTGDQDDVVDARPSQRSDRVMDHGLVEDIEQVFVDSLCHRGEPSSEPSRKHHTFHESSPTYSMREARQSRSRTPSCLAFSSERTPFAGRVAARVPSRCRYAAVSTFLTRAVTPAALSVALARSAQLPGSPSPATCSTPVMSLRVS